MGDREDRRFEREKIFFGIRIQRGLLSDARRVAAAEEMTVSQLVRRLLRQYVAQKDESDWRRG